MNPGDAEAEKKFKEASEAYAVLSDPEKRRQYDQYGHAAFDGAGGAGGFGGFDFNGADFGDIFGDIFGDLFGGSRRGGGRGNGPMKGANIRTSVRITFEEAVFGVEREIELTLKDECTSCHGTGAKPGTSPETCGKCGGKGQVVFTSQSFFGTVRNVQTCPDCHGTGKVIKDKCPDCRARAILPIKRRYRFPFLRVLTTDSASASAIRASLVQTAAPEVIFWLKWWWEDILFSSGRMKIFIPPYRCPLPLRRWAAIS